MADKTSIINRLRYYRDRAIFVWLTYVFSGKAARGRLLMFVTWTLALVLVSLFNHLVEKR